jgi:hypothetical protein
MATAARRWLHSYCFFLREEPMKHGGVALPEVVIGDSLPVAVGGCWEVGALEGGGEGGRRGCTGPTVEMEPKDLIDVNGEA